MDILVSGDEDVTCWSCEARATVTHLGGRALLDCGRCGLDPVDPWWKIRNTDGGLWHHPSYLPLSEEDLEEVLEDLPDHIPDSWARQQDWLIDTLEALLFREPSISLRPALLESIPDTRIVPVRDEKDLVWRHIIGTVGSMHEGDLLGVWIPPRAVRPEVSPVLPPKLGPEPPEQLVDLEPDSRELVVIDASTAVIPALALLTLGKRGVVLGDPWAPGSWPGLMDPMAESGYPVLQIQQRIGGADWAWGPLAKMFLADPVAAAGKLVLEPPDWEGNALGSMMQSPGAIIKLDGEKTRWHSGRGVAWAQHILTASLIWDLQDLLIDLGHSSEDFAVVSSSEFQCEVHRQRLHSLDFQQVYHIHSLPPTLPRWTFLDLPQDGRRDIGPLRYHKWLLSLLGRLQESLVVALPSSLLGDSSGRWIRWLATLLPLSSHRQRISPELDAITEGLRRQR